MQRIVRVQTLHITPERAWSFFSNPQNLSKITPPHLRFRILTNDGIDGVYAGCLISYTLRPVAGIPVRWITEITHVDQGRYFVDSQLSGPYKLWHHQHHFKAVNGGVEITDIVHFSIGFGFLGRLIEKKFILPMVTKIFHFRQLKMNDIFPDVAPSNAQ